MSSVTQKTVETKIPARMDRLPWTRWHWFVVFSLGIVWILDGLEVTIKGAVGPSLRESLNFTTVGVAGTASIYLLGAVSGALVWGYLTDRFGRQKIFIATIIVYIIGVTGTALTGLFAFTGEGYEYVWFAIFRFITGAGIGGEYAAINSTIHELIPARVRGWVDLAINGSYWIGTAVGAVLGALYLNIFPPDVAFRVAFGMGLILGLGILALRFFVPESPRWLMTHGYEDQAEETVRQIERDVMDKADLDELPEPDDEDAITLRERRSIGFVELGRTLFKLYPQRSVAGGMLLLTQAFLYNAIFFTFGLMLTTFFGVANADVGWFLIPFAVGNFLGPLLLGRFFDTVGRKTMIPLTFLTAGGLTVLAGLLFATGVIGSAWLMTLFWVGIFFFASAGASAGYLTVSETFPLEVRAMAIAFFYATATFIGGVFGPILFGALISGEQRWTVFWGYLVGAALMATGGLVHRRYGVEAAQMGLESVTMPLSAQEAEEGAKPSLEGPAGIDPTDPESVRQFQQEHDLETDGRIGPATAALLHREERDGGQGGISVVDVTDTDAIRRFQADLGLEPDGVLGPVTAGAVRAAQRRGIVDPADAESVKAFQRTHLLEQDGEIGPDTQAALRAVRAEQTGEPSAYMSLDMLDRESIERFQRSCGLQPDGVIGPETRGALLAERARRARNLGVDPTDGEAIRRFQRDHGLEDDGVIGARTREALERLRQAGDEAPGGDGVLGVLRSRFGVDPVDPESVERFQREAGLETDGAVGPQTRRALRRAPHLLVDLDPTDGTSIERFQREHDLEADGVIGPETQAVLRDLHQELAAIGREEDEDDEEQEPPQFESLIGFDAADRESVERFQRDHGLAVDGCVGPETQAALRAALADQEQEIMRRPARRTRARAPRPRAHMSSGLPTFSSIPGEDRELEAELEDLTRALDEHGPMSRDELRRELNARLWGPGRFRYVLRTAEEEGEVRRIGRDRYETAGR